MNVAPALTSSSVEVISFELLTSSTSRAGLSAVKWCASRGIALATKARHADLAGVFDSTPFAGVSALAALTEKRLSGELPAGSVLLLDSIPGLTHLHFTELILRLVELSKAGVTVVTLAGSERRWSEDLSSDLGVFLLTVAELAVLSRARDVRSQRAKMSHQQRRESKAQAGEVAQ